MVGLVLVWDGVGRNNIQRQEKSAVGFQPAAAENFLGEHLLEHLGFVNPVFVGNAAKFFIHAGFKTGGDSDPVTSSPLQVRLGFLLMTVRHKGVIRRNILSARQKIDLFLVSRIISRP